MSEIFGNGIMGGGGLTNSKLALANAQAADVRSGKKFYAGDKQIKTGALADVTQATPAITVDAAGKITASATQAAGVVAAGTKSATKQLPVQAAKTVIPSASAQTAVGKGVFTTGIVTVAAVYAAIGVTYPSGSVCTCTNGTLTMTAKDTSGKAIFVIPSAGTWTVTATDGTNTKSKSVEITSEGQSVSVKLDYMTYLFREGIGQITPFTSAKEKNATISINANGIVMNYTSVSNGQVGVSTTDMVDLSNYSELIFDAICNRTTTHNEYTNAAVVINTKKIDYTGRLPDFKAYNAMVPDGVRREYAIDISSFNAKYYIGAKGLIDGTIYNIWLE